MINMGRYTKDEVYVYNEILFSHDKGNAAVCNNLDEAWKHYAKWNKSDRERQMWYYLHVEYWKKPNLEI